MLTLAFDTATGIATSALVRDGEVLGERASRAVRVLADAEELLEEAGAEPRELNRLVVTRQAAASAPSAACGRCSVARQTYIEDCSVCCRPIQITVSCEEGGLSSVEVERE